jgi:CRISPR-associated protein Cmr1
MEVKIQTLTPIWTGGIEAGKCDRIHETGLLGSLRWWMEVLVRGMGGVVCDPTTEGDRYRLDPKKFDLKTYHKFQTDAERRKYLRDAGVCDVSQIFGTTGWKRQFRLEVDEIEISDAEIKHTITASRSYPDMKRPPTWYFRDPTKKDVQPALPNTPKAGCFIIKIQSLNPNFKPEIIAGLIQYIADWSALGARPQMGFGVIQVMNEDFSKSIQINTQALYDWLITTRGTANSTQLDNYKHLPSLQNIFLAKIQPKDSIFDEKSTFNLKYDLRQLFRTTEDKSDVKSTKLILKKDQKKNQVTEEQELRHFIMGVVPEKSSDDNKRAAKIKMSRPYQDEKIMRVWGWIPEDSKFYKNGWDRKTITQVIYKHLQEQYNLTVWRETNSPRDTVTPNQIHNQEFLHSLLGLSKDV